jgi:hypothetical protein
MASAIENGIVSGSPIGALELDAVDVSFGVTLCSGVQAIFTTSAESSVQVTISLRRRMASTS